MRVDFHCHATSNLNDKVKTCIVNRGNVGSQIVTLPTYTIFLLISLLSIRLGIQVYIK